MLIVAVGLAAAVPSFKEALERRRITGAIESITSRVAVARSEAIKRNENVSVTIKRTSATDWCLGARSDTTAACDCDQTTETAADYCGFPDVTDATKVLGQRLTSDDLNGVELETAGALFGANSVFAFDPVTGTLDNLGDTGAFVVSTTSGDYKAQITISPSGLASICLPNTAAEFGRYAICP